MRRTPAGTLVYWDGGHAESFTTDPYKAVQWPTKDAAVRACPPEHYAQWGWNYVEHGFIEQAAAPASAPSQIVPPTTAGGNEVVVENGIYKSRPARPFSELRAQMSPESQARATARTKELLAEIPASAPPEGIAALRRVPEAYSLGSDRCNAQKAWLDGFDTAERALSSHLAAFQRREAALRKIVDTAECCEKEICGPPEAYRCVVCRLRAALASPDPEKEPTP